MSTIWTRRNRVLIQERGSDRNILAWVVDLTESIAHRQIGCRWWSGPQVPVALSGREKDQAWDWVGRARAIQEQTEDGLFGRALITARPDKTIEVQSALLGSLAFHSPRERGERSLYLQWLASHPQNRVSLVGEGQAKYRNAGRMLVFIALLESYYAGFGGRVTLIPLQGTERFYEKLKFRKILDSTESRRYYEIDPGEAQDLLREEGWI